jgi:hypothetical protein
MGFLNKARETKNLKSVSKERKRQPSAKAIEAENAKKPQKHLLNIFLKNPQPAPTNNAAVVNTNPSSTTPSSTTTTIIATALNFQNPPGISVPRLPEVKPFTNVSAGLDWHISDLVFLVEGKKIPTHKVVLVSRCAYFAKLFQDIPAGVVSSIEITEFSHHIFSRFVRLVYGGKKDNIQVEDVPELVRCAQHYQASEIASVCQEVAAEANRMQMEAQAALEAEQAGEIQQVQETQFQDPQLQYQLQMQAQAQLQAQLEYQMFQHQQQQLQQHQLQQQQEAPQEMEDMTQFTSNQHLMGNELFLGTENSIQDLVGDSTDNFGMNIWSNDPILFNNNDSFETSEAYRIVEIC